MPGLILLALVMVAAVLLIVGYGIAIGLGLLVGIAIGLVVGLIGGLWLGVEARGRSLSVGSLTLSTSEDTSSFEMPEVLRDIERVQRVDHGDLVRAIAGDAVADAAGVRVELIALEIRSAGAVAHLAAAAEPPMASLGSFAQVAVEDDLGTAYVAAALGVNGSPDRTRFEVRFAPAPPVAAAVLRVRVDEFLDPFPQRSRAAIVGPWVVSVDLR